MIDDAQQEAQLQEKLDKINDAIKAILIETGAPSMQELIIRYKRFAQIALELPTKLDIVENQMASLRIRLEREQESYKKLHEANSALRNEKNSLQRFGADSTSKLNVAAEAMHVALMAFDSPAYSSLAKESRAAVRALNAAMRTVGGATGYVIKGEADDTSPSA
jgi:chromosome segregation ATPase